MGRKAARAVKDPERLPEKAEDSKKGESDQDH